MHTWGLSTLTEPVLSLSGFSAFYGNARALSDVDLRVEEGEIVTIIGSNGAGKTTLLRGIVGAVRVDGQARYRGTDLLAIPPARRIWHGIAIVSEGGAAVQSFTVEENLLMGMYALGRKGRKEARRKLDQVYARFPVLGERRNQHAKDLSGGERQILAACRVILAEAKLALFDEPSLGLAPQATTQILGYIKEIAASGTAVILAEQNADLALQTCSRAYVFETGRCVRTGTGTELQQDERVRKAYLGAES